MHSARSRSTHLRYTRRRRRRGTDLGLERTENSAKGIHYTGNLLGKRLVPMDDYLKFVEFFLLLFTKSSEIVGPPKIVGFHTLRRAVLGLSRHFDLFSLTM